MPDADSATEEIIAGTIVMQPFVNRVEDIEEMSVSFAKLYKDTQGKITVFFYDNEELLMKRTVDLSDMNETETVILRPDEPISGRKGHMLAIRIYATSEADQGVVALMRKDMPGSKFMFNEKMIDGTLCFSLTGRDENYLGKYYWYIVAVMELLLGGLLLKSYSDYLNNRSNLIVRAIAAVYHYKFLISQLVKIQEIHPGRLLEFPESFDDDDGPVPGFLDLLQFRYQELSGIPSERCRLFLFLQ